MALGPALVGGVNLHLTGQSGVVYVLAKQRGDGASCAAVPQLRSFRVTGGVHQAEMYFAATFTDWKLVRMRLDGEEWVAEQIRVPAGTHEMKFANTGDWSGIDWGNAEGLSGIAQETTGGRPNIRFSTSEPGTYTISFDDVTLEYSVVVVDLCVELEGGRIDCALRP